MASKPLCSKCGREHWNYLHCEDVTFAQIQWANRDGFHEWGDRVQGAAGGPVQKDGWGCKGILPPLSPRRDG